LFRNLTDFIKALDAAGELKTVREPVSPYLEISRLTDQESKRPGGGKGLLFVNVEASDFPVATNLFGSDKRICMALGVAHLDQLGDRVREYIEFNPPRNLREALNVIPMAINLTQFFPRMSRAKTPPCQEVVLTGNQIDLGRLPVLHCWPKDAGPFVTLPLVFTKSLVTGRRNVGMYRLQIFNRNTTGMHWHIHKDGSHYFNEYREAGKRMPVAVAVGADPATIYAATAPMPRGVDEMLLAGFIRSKPVRMARCVSVDMVVPAEAEFVLEGYVDPAELRREGPFGDHTGYYSLADDYPVFHVTAVTHRRHPVYNATLVGRPPMEDCYLAKATERLFLPMLQAVMPEIIDYWFPWEGVFHNIVIVSIKKEYPGHAHKLMSGLWGQGQMSFCKAIVVLDGDVDPKDSEAVMRALLEAFDPMTDITVTRGVLDVLDHSSPHPNFGAKIGIDLTRRFKGEPARTPRLCLESGPSPGDDTVSVDGVVATRHLFRYLQSSKETLQILAVAVVKREGRGGKQIAEAILTAENMKDFNLFVLFDADIDLSDHSLMLWKLFNNVAPDRDIVVQGGRLVVDACKKGSMDGHVREWPDDLTFDI
jgi:4-hydroxy-3-polyprenylbenzoate decarboxylase